MTISSFEGWEDLEAWEGTFRPMGQTVVAEEKPIADMRPIDEFGTPPEVEPEVKPVEVLTYRRNLELANLKRQRQILKEERSDLKVQMLNIESYPDLDTYEDGTILAVHVHDHDWYGDIHQAVLKERGKWYVAGQFHPYTWDELVAKVLREFHVSEVEVIRPPAPKESK